MPMFQDHNHNHDTVPANAEPATPPPVPIRTQTPVGSLSRKVSEESIRTELCEGPVLDDADSPKPQSPTPAPLVTATSTTTSDRAEFIERLKKGESPTWVPSRRLDPFYSPRDGSRDHHLPASSPRPRSSESLHGHHAQHVHAPDPMQQGLTIERPRSALHSGDFTQHDATTSSSSSPRYGIEQRRREIPDDADGYAPDRHHHHHHPWYSTSPPRDFSPFNKFERRNVAFPDLADGHHRSSPPSLSSSLSSSFVFKHPTSPLVQSESNDDDLSLPINAIELDPSTPTRASRRQTMHSLRSVQDMPITAQRIPSSVRREATFPYQAHQPRKSLTSAPALSLMHGSSPQASAWGGTRRTSVGIEASSSPLQRTSMVGSYEESILRGRMSTTPSKPLDFLAQIGVLGLGNCKSSLRCPAHVTLPFPAVFYSYASTSHGRSKSEDGPSPYVGQVDLENGLPSTKSTQDAASAAARRRSHTRSGSTARRTRNRGGEDVEMTGVDCLGGAADAREVAKQRRRCAPRAPPGGSYRIPEKGQIQIIIKNQNKTAVKLFLVPYDLAGMEPGTKTFIRQRSYSGGGGGGGGPVVDGGANNNDERPVLRYLVHLHICCPSRGRFYLYKSIRVVFANRVPDGKEKLRNEITLPEPRFTPYKPIRVMLNNANNNNNPTAFLPSAAASSLEALRLRGSSDFSLPPPAPPPPPAPMPEFLPSSSRARASSAQHDRGGPLPGFVVVPMDFAKGEFGGVGDGGALGAAVVAEGLLSQRLRSLGMQSVCAREAVDDDSKGPKTS